MSRTHLPYVHGPPSLTSTLQSSLPSPTPLVPKQVTSCCLVIGEGSPQFAAWSYFFQSSGGSLPDGGNRPFHAQELSSILMHGTTTALSNGLGPRRLVGWKPL